MLTSRWGLASALLAACAGAAQPAALERPAPVTVPHSESFVLRPRAGGAAYRIDVGLPLSYGREPGRRYPVVYGLDADVGFTASVAIARFLARAGELPEVIAVGIGYGGDLEDWGRRRVADLTPVAVDDHPGSGQAARFLDFIEGEVIPAIERRYRTAPDRTLIGYSLGGLFGTYALFHRPGIFQRYVLGSPSYEWGHRVALSWPSALARTDPPPTGVVFTSVDTADPPQTIANWRELWDAVERAHVAGLAVVRGEIDETHAGGWPHVIVKGMKAVFRPAEADRGRAATP